MITLPMLNLAKAGAVQGAGHEVSLPVQAQPGHHGGELHKNTTHKRKTCKVVSLAELSEGETARIVRVAMEDAGCRRRFAELGLAEGMKVTVAGVGESMMVMVGTSRMGIGRHCAGQVKVVRV